METAFFRKSRGRIIVSVICEPRAAGTYEISVRQGAGDQELLDSAAGSLLSARDGSYALKGHNRLHHGRLVEAHATVSVPASSKPAWVTLAVTQDDELLAYDSAVVPAGGRERPVVLYIRLSELERGFQPVLVKKAHSAAH